MQSRIPVRSVALKCCLFLPLLLAPAKASDIEKEKRWAEQIVDSLMVGEAVWLPLKGGDGADTFLGLYTESTQDSVLGAVIVIHGIGVHPNWSDVIHPIRSQLPEKGWASLSIQMPVLKNEATVEDYVPLMSGVAPRIEAAIGFLESKGIRNISIIAHSLGTLMASNYLGRNKSVAIKSYVALSMVENDSDEVLSNVAALKKIAIPVLDIYGSDDQKSVWKNAAKRKQVAGEVGIPRFQQVKIEGADHFYHGKEAQLLGAIVAWLGAER